jgi:hypothetical protein
MNRESPSARRKSAHRCRPCRGALCWESYNAGLRAKYAGYHKIFWYRGGLDAWQAWAATKSSGKGDQGENGDKGDRGDKDDVTLLMQSVSQTAKALAQRLSDPQESFAAKWSDAVSAALAEASSHRVGWPTATQG